MAKDEAKIKFRADTSEFSDAISKAKDVSRELTSQMKLLEAEFGNTGDKTKYLEEKSRNLQQQLATNAEKVTALNGKLEAAKKIYGENSHEAQYWATELNKAKTAQENLKTSLNNVNKEIQENISKEKQSQTASEQLTKTISEQESKLDKLKQTYVNTVLQYGKNSNEAKQLGNEIKKLSSELKDNKDAYEQVANAADELGREIEDSGKKADSAANGGYSVFKNVVANIATDVMQSATQAVKDFAASTIETGKEFYASMSEVQALSGATGEELDALTAKAKEMGSATRYTAKESADAMGYMALAGWDAQQMIDGINPILNLAAANNMDLATASDIVTDDLTAFGMEAKDAAHFADVLATTSAKSNTNIEMMGEAFQYAGSVCGSMGYSIEDAALAIGTMANSGIKASMAGTTLRSVITRLATNTGASSKSLGALDVLTQKLGVEFYESSGAARDFSDVLSEARQAWAELTAEEQAFCASKIAGKTAIAGFLALMSDEKLTLDQVGTAIEELGYNLNDMGVPLTSLQDQMSAFGNTTDMATSLVERFGFEQEDANQIAVMLSNTLSKQEGDLVSVNEAIENCGVAWEKYGDGLSAESALIDQAMDGLKQGLLDSEADIAEYIEFLSSEYEMSAEDAQIFMDAFMEAANNGASSWHDFNKVVYNCGVTWDDYSDKVWSVNNRIEGIIEQATDGLKRGFLDSEADIAEYVEFLSSEYDISIEDAQTFMDAFLESAASTSTGWSQLQESINNCDGAAQQMADTMLDNLQGDMTLMESALDGLKLKLFDDVNSPLRDIVQCVTNDVIPAATAAIDFVENHKALITGVAIAIGSVTAGIYAYNVAQGIKTAMDAAGATSLGGYAAAQLSANLAMFACPITWIVAGITALIAVVVLAVKHWDDIKAAVGAFGDACHEAFDNMAGWCDEHIGQPIKNAANKGKEAFNFLKEGAKTALSQLKADTQEKLNSVKNAYYEHGGGVKGIVAAGLEGVKQIHQTKWSIINTLTGGKLKEMYNTVKDNMAHVKEGFHSAIDNIKNMFNFNIQWPHISMPSISVDWQTEGSLAKAAQFLGLQGLPSFKVHWNASGAILNDPVLFGIAGGVLQGGGEAGPEAVTPIETLKQYMGDVLDDRINRMNNSSSYIDKVIERLDRVEKAVRESMNIELDGERMSKKLAPYNDSVNGLRSQLDERGVLV